MGLGRDHKGQKSAGAPIRKNSRTKLGPFCPVCGRYGARMVIVASGIFDGLNVERRTTKELCVFQYTREASRRGGPTRMPQQTRTPRSAVVNWALCLKDGPIVLDPPPCRWQRVAGCLVEVHSGVDHHFRQFAAPENYNLTSTPNIPLGAGSSHSCAQVRIGPRGSLYVHSGRG